MASLPRGLLLSANPALEVELAPHLGGLARTADPEALVADYATDPDRLLLLDLQAPFEPALESLSRYGAARRIRPVAVALVPPEGQAVLRAAVGLGVLDFIYLPFQPLDLELRLATAARRLWLSGELAARTEAARAGEERLRFALSQAEVSLSVVDRAGRVLFAAGQPVYPDLLPAEARVGRLTAELYARAPEALTQLRRALTGERFTEELTHPEGCSECTLVPSARDDEGVSEVTILRRDITQRVRADAERDRVERFWRQVLDALPTSVTIMGEKGVLYANAATAAIQGRPAAELGGLPHPALRLTPGQAQTLQRLHQQVLDVDQPLPPLSMPLGEPVRHYQLRMVPITTLGGERAVLGVAEDVSGLEQALVALRRAEAQLREMIDRSTDLIILTREGRLVHANPAAERVMGRTRLELLGADLRQLLLPEDQARLADRRTRATDGTPNPPLRFHLRLWDGRELTVESVTLPVSWDGGLATMSISRDVTEEERRQAQLQLADRLASVGTLAAGVAHEINNPLAFVYGNLGVALEELSRPEPGLSRAELVAALAEARAGAERVRRIVRDLQDFARPGEQAEGADAHRAVRAALELSEHQLRLRAQVEVELGPTPLVPGGEGRLTQVVLNLLVNAAQAVPEGQPERQRISVRTRTDERGWAVLEVADTGPGIPEAQRARVFDPFFTTRPVGAGIGLGLSVCHGLVTALGGEIGFDTELGRGTTFRVALPPGRPAGRD